MSNNFWILLGIGVAVVVAILVYMNATPVAVAPSMSTTTSDNQLENNEGGTTTPRTIDVQIALIAIEDNGVQGEKIGCNDSVVFIEEELPYTTGTLRAALTRLFSIDSTEYADTDLYNSLSASELTLEDVQITDGVATVEISGQPSLGGVCDAPRFKAQIEKTALQFPTVESVEVFINGAPIDEVLSSQ